MTHTKRTPTCYVYRDTAGQWRWRLRASNGRVIADSSESYTRRTDATKAARRVRGAWLECSIVVLNGEAAPHGT